MTTAKSPAPAYPDVVPVADPPKGRRQAMTTFEQLGETGNSHHLIAFLGQPETTIVSSERYLMAELNAWPTERRVPDMLVAFNVDRARFMARNAYVIAEQGKPPDFVLEIASRSNPWQDIVDKRRIYAEWGIPEYWRFDKTGQYHQARLAGEVLAEGEYRPVEIGELAPDILEGYSAALGLNIRWERQQLFWYDPGTGQPIPSFQSERARAERETARAEQETARAERETARAERERAARLAAEEQIRRLEERLRRYEG